MIHSAKGSKNACVSRKMTQAELSEKIGLLPGENGQIRICQYEKGSHHPREKTLEKIAYVLAVDAEWLKSGLLSKKPYCVYEDYYSFDEDRINEVQYEQRKEALITIMEPEFMEDTMNLLFFDIDGTLANGKYVPESADKAIQQARKNGDLVFICTGRNVSYACGNFHDYADGFVCNNGRLAVLQNEVICDEPIPSETLDIILKKLDEVGAAYVFHTIDKGYLGGNPEGYSFLEIAGDAGYMVQAEDIHAIRAYNYDIWFRDLDHRLKIEKALKGISLVNPHDPHPTADMTVVGFDKGEALVRVAESLNVHLENTYAFGDGVNDVSMLKKAGHGIAMGNGVNEVKEIAEFITTDIDKDGIYNALKHYGLI